MARALNFAGTKAARATATAAQEAAKAALKKSRVTVRVLVHSKAEGTAKAHPSAAIENADQVCVTTRPAPALPRCLPACVV